MRLAFDIETDGLPRQGLSKIHCIVARDLDHGHVHRFREGYLLDGVRLLSDAELLVGHNIVSFDIPVLKQFFPDNFHERDVIDTLILSQMRFPDILNRDFRQKPIGMPVKLYGRHSLEAWGYRLGEYKDGFCHNTDWKEWSQEMEDYCTQDVIVSATLFGRFSKFIEEHGPSIQLEHECARIMAQQEFLGWPFDVKAAQTLELELQQESCSLADAMRDKFPYVEGSKFTPARDNKSKGYIKGAVCTKLKEFNPTSRDHIAWAFQTWRGWKPEEKTDTGKPKIDETVLLGIGTEEAKTFARLLDLQKALGQLSSGKNSWLQRVTPEGRIHHRCVLATNTGRNAHSNPNLGQVASDPRCRALFVPPEGMVQIGADASGLELRMLGHYLAFFDGGRFADIVVNGDIHQINADATSKALEIEISRSEIKTLTYAFLYGAGDAKLGSTVAKALMRQIVSVPGDFDEHDLKVLDKRFYPDYGKRARVAFVQAIPGLGPLLDAVAKKADGDILKGLDGRPIRLQGKKHAALNYLLQSAGAIVCKKWLIDSYGSLERSGLIPGVNYQPLGFIHDEIQLACTPIIAEVVKTVLTSTMPNVGKHFKLKVPLAAEAKEGESWADCH